MADVRLIDANALMEDIELCRNVEYYSVMDREIHDSKIDFALDAVREAPTIEAEPVRHGRWIQVDGTKCKCSECEVITLIAQYPNGNKNYCPNCGAKMGLEGGK